MTEHVITYLNEIQIILTCLPCILHQGLMHNYQIFCESSYKSRYRWPDTLLAVGLTHNLSVVSL